jgi:hypothetical protein
MWRPAWLQYKWRKTVARRGNLHGVECTCEELLALSRRTYTPPSDFRTFLLDANADESRNQILARRIRT